MAVEGQTYFDIEIKGDDRLLLDESDFQQEGGEGH